MKQPEALSKEKAAPRPEDAPLAESARRYLARMKETSPEAAEMALDPLLREYGLREMLTNQDVEMLRLILHSRHMKDGQKAFQESLLFVKTALLTEADLPALESLINIFLYRYLPSRQEKVRIDPDPLKREVLSALLSFPDLGKSIVTNRGWELLQSSHNFPDLIATLLRNSALREIMIRTHGSHLIGTDGQEAAVEEALERPEVQRALVSSFGTALLVHAVNIPRAIKKIIQSREFREALIVHDNDHRFLQFSRNFPAVAEGVLKDKEIQKELVTTDPHQLLRYAYNYPAGMKEILQDERLRQILVERASDSLVRYCHNFSDVAENLEKDETLPKDLRGRLAKRRRTVERGRPEFLEKLRSLTREELLKEGFERQNELLAKEEFQQFWDTVEKTFGIRVDPGAEVSFGFEIEPEKEGVIVAEEELRSFTLTDPSSIPNILKEYVAYLQSHLPPVGKQYGAMLGTLHFNIGLSLEKYQKVAGNWRNLFKIVGALVIATSDPPRIRHGIRQWYLSPSALGKVYLHDTDGGIAPLAPGLASQVVRLEIKGFSVPQDQSVRERLQEGLSWLAGVMAEPERLGNMEISGEAHRTLEEILTLVYGEEQKAEMFLDIAPGDRLSSRYKEMMRDLKSKLSSLKEFYQKRIRAVEQGPLASWQQQGAALKAEIRAKERELEERTSPELMAQYRGGENVEPILRNIKLGTLWEEIQKKKAGLHALEVATATLPEMQQLAKDKKSLDTLRLAESSADEAMDYVRSLRTSVLTARKKIAVLQRALFDELTGLR